MHQNDVLMLGLGLASPWKLLDQHLDVEASPNELQLSVGTERSTQFQCPKCAELCPAHDYQQKKWRHLNFFQHHCYITAKVPRIKCAEHGVHLIEVRHRTIRTKGALSQKTAKPRVFTIIQEASKKWLRLKGKNQLPKVIQGVKFNDGIEINIVDENQHHLSKTAITQIQS